jgi:hypothetical protein
MPFGGANYLRAEETETLQAAPINPEFLELWENPNASYTICVYQDGNPADGLDNPADTDNRQRYEPASKDVGGSCTLLEWGCGMRGRGQVPPPTNLLLCFHCVSMNFNRVSTAFPF